MYFNDILVFNVMIKLLHIKHLIILFEKPRETKLYVNITKYEFVVSKVHFFWFHNQCAWTTN